TAELRSGDVSRSVYRWGNFRDFRPGSVKQVTEARAALDQLSADYPDLAESTRRRFDSWLERAVAGLNQKLDDLPPTDVKAGAEVGVFARELTDAFPELK